MKLWKIVFLYALVAMWINGDTSFAQEQKDTNCCFNGFRGKRGHRGKPGSPGTSGQRGATGAQGPAGIPAVSWFISAETLNNDLVGDADTIKFQTATGSGFSLNSGTGVVTYDNTNNDAAGFYEVSFGANWAPNTAPPVPPSTVDNRRAFVLVLGGITYPSSQICNDNTIQAGTSGVGKWASRSIIVPWASNSIAPTFSVQCVTPAHLTPALNTVQLINAPGPASAFAGPNSTSAYITVKKLR